MPHLIKVYHGFNEGIDSFKNFLEDLSQTMKKQTVILGFHYQKGEVFYSVDTPSSSYAPFEGQFYTHFNNFQISQDNKKYRRYTPKKSVIGEINLAHKGFFPFKYTQGNESDFISTLLRGFENFDVIHDKFSFFVQLKAINNEGLGFFLGSKLKYKQFRIELGLQFYKYLFNVKGVKNWKSIGDKYYKDKLQKNLFDVQIFMVSESSNKAVAEGKIKSIFNSFEIFRNHPLNQFKIKIHKSVSKIFQGIKKYNNPLPSYLFTSEEIASIFHFPKGPGNESSLLSVKSKKLALPVGIPSLDYTKLENGEVIAKAPGRLNVVGISDYRSITVPVGIYDEDRLKHTYIVGKTGVGKSKFMYSLIINDIKQGKGFGVIDPHGDAIGEIMMHIPEKRKKDVIIFDPTDEKFPFCLNPLDIEEGESKQILAKGFIDIFKKFFGTNRNAKLEHVLRMIFLALLDKQDATLFDIIRALTNKDFRYDMIDQIQDDVVRNFWTNEFAGWSQQFNTEAIMPILNKVGQLLSIDILKNIFASPDNKLDFRKVMDESKILLIKLPKGKLQEEVMGFLGSMFITKIFQTAMGRQSVDQSQRTPFFLYVDEFQNFATDTFSEILSEARKYGLGLTVAHQFVKQIPEHIANALFGNVGTLISFRISSDDAEIMKNHFAPFLTGYDLANLNAREFYCKMLVQGQVKDPFSLRTTYTPDIIIDPEHIQSLYEISRTSYNRTLEEAKQVVETKIKDVEKTIEEFAEPII